MASTYSERMGVMMANPEQQVKTPSVGNWAQMAQNGPQLTAPKSAGSKVSGLTTAPQAYEKLKANKTAAADFVGKNKDTIAEIQRRIDDGEDPLIVAQDVQRTADKKPRSLTDDVKSTYNGVLDYFGNEEEAPEEAFSNKNSILGPTGLGASPEGLQKSRDRMEGLTFTEQALQSLSEHDDNPEMLTDPNDPNSTPSQIATTKEAKRGIKPSTSKIGDVVEETLEEKLARTEAGAIEGTEAGKSVSSEQGGLSKFFSEKNVRNGIGDVSQGLIDYAIAYGQSGGDQMKALSAGIQGTMNQAGVNGRKKDAAELKAAGLSDAQINVYQQTGKLSAQSEAQLGDRQSEGAKLKAAEIKAAGSTQKKATEQMIKAQMAANDQEQAISEIHNFKENFGDDFDNVLANKNGGFGSSVIRAFQDSWMQDESGTAVGNYKKANLVPDEYKAALTLAKTFIEGPLRLNSGAALNADEKRAYMERYFPQSEDSDALIQQKRRARASINNTMKSVGGRVTEDETRLIVSDLAAGDYERAIRTDDDRIAYTKMKDGVEYIVGYMK